MKLNNEKLAELIEELVDDVTRNEYTGYEKSEKPIGVAIDGAIITIAVYSESEARENGFDADDIEEHLIEFEERGE